MLASVRGFALNRACRGFPQRCSPHRQRSSVFLQGPGACKPAWRMLLQMVDARTRRVQAGIYVCGADLHL